MQRPVRPRKDLLGDARTTDGGRKYPIRRAGHTGHGRLRPDLGRKAFAGDKGEAMKALIPTRRFALPEEVAASVVLLLSDAASMISDADLLIDGGYTVR